MRIAGAYGAFGVDVVGQGLVEIEQVATYQRDRCLFEEVLLVKQFSWEVIGQRELAQLDPSVVNNTRGGYMIMSSQKKLNLMNQNMKTSLMKNSTKC